MWSMHDDRTTGTKLEADVLSAPMLMAIGKREFRSLIKEFKNAPNAYKKTILRNLCKDYHRHGGAVSDPMLAAEEIVLRTLYEVLAGKISEKALKKKRWLSPWLRDPGHHYRMMKLVNVVMGSEMAYKSCKAVRWLGLRKAIKKIVR
jgi:hypothetical protein